MYIMSAHNEIYLVQYLIKEPSLLPVYCQCIASVLPVYCQCIASVYKVSALLNLLYTIAIEMNSKDISIANVYNVSAQLNVLSVVLK
jgi:hypothetical protein